MIRRRLTFSNVLSFVALFVALSAGSYAAIALPKNSVGSAQLKAKAVTTPKIATNAITTETIAADAVDGSKVKDGSLSGADINVSTLGKVPSAAAADSAAISRVKIVSANGNSRTAAGEFQCPCPVDSITANCDAGLVVIGGGGSLSDQNHQLMNDSFPSGTSGWTVHVSNAGTTTPAFTSYAICAPAASTQ